MNAAAPARVVVIATLEVGTADVPTFLDAAREAMALAREEPGCETYVFSGDLARSDTFHILEVWRDQEAFAAHVASEHHAVFRARLGACEVRRRRIDRIEGGARTTIADG